MKAKNYPTMRALWTAGLLLAVTLAPTANAQKETADPSPGKAIIVLDASGSMWGQIDGVAKIDIAKDVIKELLATLDPQLELGLMAYGHRRKGDCEDIELMIEPGKVDRAKFLETVESISPKGKTPLTASVEQAAMYLNYKANRASVILVSDGIENCDRDPCELAKLLRKNGIDFKAHVIAFDLTEKDAKTIRCLSDETGGQFLPAQDAGTLKDALQMAVREVIELATAPLVKPDPATPVPVAPPLEILDPATVKGPAEVVAGARFDVAWEGPDNKGDYIQVVAKDSPDHINGNYRYTFNGSPITLIAPVEPGPCELRYRTPSGKILGRAAILVVEALATLKGPAEAVAASQVLVAWTGPANKGDFLTFAPIGAPPTKYLGYSYARKPGELKVRAPLDAGDYELRYLTGRKAKVLAVHKMKITPAEASLVAPETVMAGANFDVEWTGPANPSEFIAVGPKGAPNSKFKSYAYPRKSPVQLTAPPTPGVCEVRYFGRGSRILASIEIEVTSAEVSFEAPAKVLAGSPVEVKWSGPNGKHDYIVIVSKGAPDKSTFGYAYTKKGSPLTVTAPETPGAAELRYVSGQQRTVLKRHPITLEVPTATVSGPASVKVKQVFEVKWTGPGNARDRIAIVPAGAAPRLPGSYKTAKAGNPSKVRAPNKPGKYELRYVTGGANKVLASQPITVTE